MNDHKLISLDMFDTIVTRQVARPSDIWKILALMPDSEQLLTRRWQSEKALLLKGGHFDISKVYADIFLDDHIALNAVNTEIELDLLLQVPRPSMQKYLAEIKAQSIPIIITSDTIFSGEVLRRMACRAGVPRSVPILSSCEVGASKADGDLYQTITNRTGVKAQDILHIGDNEAVDIVMAQSKGLKTKHIKSPFQNYVDCPQHASVFAGFAKTIGAAESVCIGVMKNKWFDSPVKSAYQGDPKQFGYMTYGPVVLAICLWLIRNAEDRGIKHIAFVSRDGFIFKKCIEIIAAKKKSDIRFSYLLASRHFSTILKIQSLEDLNRELNKHVGTIYHRLKKILGPCIDQIRIDDFSDLPEGLENFRRIDIGIYRPILKITKEQSDVYRSYISDLGLVDGDALFDIGYQGTTQEAIERTTQFELQGFYIMTFPEIKDVMGDGFQRTHAFLSAKNDSKIWRDFERYRQLSEAVLSAPHGSFLGFNEQKNPIFGEAEPSKAMNEIHWGIEDFVQDFCCAWPLTLSKAELSKDFAFAHLMTHYRKPNDPDDVKMLTTLFFDDGFRKSRRLAFVDPTSSKQTNVVWKEGQKLLHEPLAAHIFRRSGKRLLANIVQSVTGLFLSTPAKKRKLNRDPVMFFSDSHNGFIRKLARLFY